MSSDTKGETALKLTHLKVSSKLVTDQQVNLRGDMKHAAQREKKCEGTMEVVQIGSLNSFSQMPDVGWLIHAILFINSAPKQMFNEYQKVNFLIIFKNME